ncbi:RagB/SusD family nutrient uptake outer membrane protein [Mucilaginibacter sp. KACC 22063]|uniref:RagB/SusD family nutrient uptake outer membrane protein n=1 Tax=Mucilaginibacter sp. KACC 22063 TaxID=3025666 RepID=UPI0023652CBB|nr:RagB/SusD family nutrient uptake outer membrane protein [Mucilaginibacter sp. KACC 22063]WDF55854.1 RagB/SusD family nutrient uptake outer membrane protein [Mucilaginibacter sp. KACC 22063]
MRTKCNVFIIVLMIFYFTSCKKFLDPQPISTPTDEATWQSDGDANAAVAGIYALIRAAHSNAISYYAYGDLPSGEFSNTTDGSFLNVLNMQWGTAVPAANVTTPLLILRTYTPYYTAIAQSNRCLARIAVMPADNFNGNDVASKTVQKNRYLGEAYFTRAYSYFELCRIYGDVPLVLNNDDKSVSLEYARTDQTTVLKQAISDLRIAIKDLDWKNGASADRVVRADRGAAYALLAHIYAWMGDYDDCNAACDQVINSGSYSLVGASNYLDIYKGQSSEGIFEIARNSISESSQANNGYTLAGATLTSPYIPSITTPNWQVNNGLVAQLYTDTTDVRFTKGFSMYTNGPVSYYECIKYTNIQMLNNNPSYLVSLNNIIIFRLADIELLKAEALCAKSTPDYTTAQSIINNIRANRNAAPITGLTAANTLQTVIDERGRELFLEGHRFYDLVRLERLNNVQQFDNITTSEFKAGKYYWPVDPSLFLNNSKLTQTKFWQGKVSQ